MNFKLTSEGRKFLREVEKLKQLEVRVGYQSGDKAYEDGTDLVQVAIWNELGSADRPARPFLKQSIENHEKELNQMAVMMLTTLAEGRTAEMALKKVGTMMEGVVKEEIVEGNFAPNAPSTIRSKGSAQPLIDTGLMRQSVHHVIKSRGGD